MPGLSSYGCILPAGATSVFVGICYQTYDMDFSWIESCVVERTKAIIPVHLFRRSARLHGAPVWLLSWQAISAQAGTTSAACDRLGWDAQPDHAA